VAEGRYGIGTWLAPRDPVLRFRGSKKGSIVGASVEHAEETKPLTNGKFSMGIFTSTEFNSLQDLFNDQLQDIYDAELRLIEALPKMASAAESSQLSSAFREHLQETERQVERLERVFEVLGEKPSRKTCDAMKGLVSEGEEIVNAQGDATVRDAAIIAAAQRVEHYEMAVYGTLRNLAGQLGLVEARELMQETLNEEGSADHKLTQIAEHSTNPQASKT
jgi:ferritin-like metal-binding protein YciE